MGFFVGCSFSSSITIQFFLRGAATQRTRKKLHRETLIHSSYLLENKGLQHLDKFEISFRLVVPFFVSRIICTVSRLILNDLRASKFRKQ